MFCTVSCANNAHLIQRGENNTKVLKHTQRTNSQNEKAQAGMGRGCYTEEIYTRNNHRTRAGKKQNTPDNAEGIQNPNVTWQGNKFFGLSSPYVKVQN